MKKIYILGLFLLIFSFLFVIFPNTASAEIEGYTPVVSCFVSNSENGDFFEVENFKSSKSLTMDYSDFLSGGKILLSADLVQNENATSPVGPLYTWIIDKVTVSQSKQLLLSSSYTLETYNKPLIKVGSTGISLIISDTNSTSQTKVDIQIQITDNLSELKMNCATSKIPNTLTDSTTDLKFYANIPKVSKQLSYLWQIKTPNSSTYLTASTTYEYVFSRSEMIGGYGYGEYKLIAIGKDISANKTYYSQTYSLVIEPNHEAVTYGQYQLTSRVIENSLTNIEAFEYTLSDITNLIPENVHWYINDSKVASGLVFTYEPTTRAEYKLSVKYASNEKETPQDLATPIKVTPKTTGLQFLYITIGTVVVTLSLILFISIKVSNKKRDVVW